VHQGNDTTQEESTKEEKSQGKTRCKHARGQSAEKKASSHSVQVQGTSPGKKGASRRKPTGNKDAPSLVGEDVMGPFRMHRIFLDFS